MDRAAVQLLHDLCNIPSPSFEEAAAVAFMVDAATTLGMKTFVDGAGNFVAERGTGARTLVLLGHIDTVRGFFPPRIDASILYGRGAVDAKGPLAAFLLAVARSVDTTHLRVVVIGAVQEEAPTSAGAHYVLEQYRPDFAIIGEPSGVSSITLGYKGRVNMRYQARRDHAHTAAAERSVAADMVAAWTAIETYCAGYNDSREIFAQVIPHLAHCHTSSDGLRDMAEMEASFRLPVECDVSALEAVLASVVGDSVDLTFYGYQPAFRAGKNNALVRAFLHSIRAEALEPRFKLKTGTSDMNIVGPVWRCPIVAYGPGNSHFDHRPDEQIELEEYGKSIAVLQRVIERLDRS